MKGREGKAKARNGNSHHRPKSRPQQHLRHRTEFPVVDRRVREDVIEDLRARFGEHAQPLLLLARYGAVTARRFDSFMRFIDWLFAFRDTYSEVPWPREVEPGVMSLPGDATTRLDVARLVANARQVERVLKAQVHIAETLTAFENNFAQTEPLRDVDLMMGAIVVKYARDYNVKIDHRDLAALAVAIGIEKPSEDPRTDWNRWYKRMSKVRRTARRVRYEAPELKSLDDAKFFDPL